MGLSKAWPTAWFLIVVAAVAVGVATMRRWVPTGISDFYFVRQDVPIACAMLAATLALPFLKLGPWWQAEVRPSPRMTLLGAALLVVIGVAGHWLVMWGYDLSRDQSMATFAAEQVMRGELVTKVPVEWQAFGRAMMPLYYHASLRPELAWASGYLPVNSAIQGLGGIIAHPAIANPLLLVIGLAALWKVASRIWPDRRDAAVVAVLICATSAQLITNAMTSFAMVGHFALNMVWLWLFLRNDRAGVAGALLVAFLAMGLHQVHFHPMFAAPFLLWLAFRRQWLSVAAYAVGYGAIFLFWTDIYPAWLASHSPAYQVVSHSTVSQSVVPQAGQVREFDLIEYIIGRASRLFDYSSKVWLFNFIRFFAWQNILSLPLVAASFWFLRKWRDESGGIFVPLAGSCLIGLVFLVFQGHGFGYRYLSGLIGCFCLLAGYGWIGLVPEQGPSRAWAIVKAACCFALLVTLPLQLAMARDMVSPYARLHAAVLKADADVVLIDTEGGFLAQDLVQNGPAFDQRPKTMDLALVPVEALEHLCTTNRVMRIDRRHYRAIGMREGRIAPQVHVRLQERRPVLDRLNCAPPMPLGA